MSTENIAQAYGQPTVGMSFTSFSSAVDLRAQSGQWNHSPQRLVAVNLTDTAQVLEVTDQAGTTLSYVVPAGDATAPTDYPGSLQVDLCCKTITDNTTASKVYAYWWTDGVLGRKNA